MTNCLKKPIQFGLMIPLILFKKKLTLTQKLKILKGKSLIMINILLLLNLISLTNILVKD